MPVTSPILVLDSGLGGLTVVRALRRVLPYEDILYFGDTARVPYGSKTAATVIGFVRQIISYFQPYDPKHVVIACNTATALTLGPIREEFPHLSISGVIEPGSRAAVDAAGDRIKPLIGVIGTEATISSGAYERAILRRQQSARVVSRPTPLLVPIIEEGRPQDDPLVHLALQQYLQPLITQQINVLVLGCTHYPVYKDLIAQIMGPQVAVIDSADKCAEDVLRRLRVEHLDRSDRRDRGSLRCFVTDRPPRFASLAARFLGLTIDEPTWVSLDELHALTSAADVGLRPAV
ncbi:MAG: glutamate racemase [Bacillota bacterium]